MAVWFLFTLLSVIAVAIAEISQKISLTQKVNISSITNNFFIWISMGTIGVALSLITGNVRFISNISDLFKLILLGIVYFFGGTLFFSSYKGNSPSISQILASVSVIVSTSLGIILFNEPLSFYKFAGTILVLLSILIINIGKKERFNKFNLLALLGGICYGIAYSIDKSFSLNLHPFNYLILMGYSVAIVSLVLKYKLIISETKRMKLGDFKPLLSSILFFTIFDVCSFFAYKNGASVGIVDAMNSISIFLVIFAEIIILKDKSNLFKKFIGAGVAFFGVLLFSFIK